MIASVDVSETRPAATLIIWRFVFSLPTETTFVPVHGLPPTEAPAKSLEFTFVPESFLTLKFFEVFASSVLES